MRVLFVCTANQQRSPTAEEIFQKEYETKSAGVDPGARVVLTKALLLWADIIFVMEDWHKKEITSQFPKESLHKKIIVLDISDRYTYMDANLITLLREKVKTYI